MCDEINDPKVYGTLKYIIRDYNHDDKTVEIRTLNGRTYSVPYADIVRDIATAWNGKYTNSGELFLHYYVDGDDNIVNLDNPMHIKKWDVERMISEYN